MSGGKKDGRNSRLRALMLRSAQPDKRLNIRYSNWQKRQLLFNPVSIAKREKKGPAGGRVGRRKNAFFWVIGSEIFPGGTVRYAS
jgi:hypothetical protein